MKTWLAVASLAFLANCKAARWNGHKAASELHIAGFTINIPDGWRSTAELNASGDLAKYRPAAGSVGMMPEADREGVLTASVTVTASPRDASSSTTCAQAVEKARTHYSPPISDVHDGGSVCTWRVALGRLVGTVGIRLVGDHEIAVQCLIDAAGDGEAEEVCDEVLRTLQTR